jgi:hypothetical protein
MNLRTALITSTLLVTPLFVRAQTGVPVPSQLSTAHTAFLASGAASAGGARQSLIAQMIYTSTYKALVADGQYRLAAAPSQAELSMIVSTDMAYSDVTNGSSIAFPFLRLDIYDTATHSLLWTLEEPVRGAWREKSFQKNIDDAVALLVSDLKTLAAGSIPGNPTTPKPEPVKTRISDEGKK